MTIEQASKKEANCYLPGSAVQAKVLFTITTMGRLDGDLTDFQGKTTFVDTQTFEEVDTFVVLLRVPGTELLNKTPRLLYLICDMAPSTVYA